MIDSPFLNSPVKRWKEPSCIDTVVEPLPPLDPQPILKEPDIASNIPKSKREKESFLTLVDERGISEEDRGLVVSFPRSLQTNVNDSKRKKDIHYLKGKPMNEYLTYAMLAGTNKRRRGLALQFPSTQMRNKACWNLEAHPLQLDAGEPFELCANYHRQPASNFLPVLEVEIVEALSFLAIIVRFLPLSGHLPVYTLHCHPPEVPDKALRPAATDCPISVLKEPGATENADTGGDCRFFLSAKCSQGVCQVSAESRNHGGGVKEAPRSTFEKGGSGYTAA
ncbi:MAG: hypothetical protein Q9166_002281 [cf. Caloplaca sp. 2 TL-2023]